MLSKKDRKHLREFGEMHPADVESARIKEQTKVLFKKSNFDYSCEIIILP